MTQQFILTRGASDNCQTCAQQFKDGVRRHQTPAVYTLARGMERWPLCLQHACASAHNLGIVCSFNPLGVIATTEKKAP